MQNQNPEWLRILTEILKNERKVSPIYMTGNMLIQQYQRALNTLRQIFGKVNVVMVDDGLTDSGKKKTYYMITRNEYTESKLRELQEQGKVSKSLWFNYHSIQKQPFEPKEEYKETFGFQFEPNAQDYLIHN